MELHVAMAHPILTRGSHAPNLFVTTTGLPFQGSYSTYWAGMMEPFFHGKRMAPRMLRHLFVDGEHLLCMLGACGTAQLPPATAHADILGHPGEGGPDPQDACLVMGNSVGEWARSYARAYRDTRSEVAVAQMAAYRQAALMRGAVAKQERERQERQAASQQGREVRAHTMLVSQVMGLPPMPPQLSCGEERDGQVGGSTSCSCYITAMDGMEEDSSTDS